MESGGVSGCGGEGGGGRQRREGGEKGDKEKMRKRTADNSITLRLLLFAGVGKGEEVEGEGGE